MLWFSDGINSTLSSPRPLCSILKHIITRANVFPWQILPNSAVQFVKFREILQRYYPQIPYILRPVGVVVLTDNISKYKGIYYNV